LLHVDVCRKRKEQINYLWSLKRAKNYRGIILFIHFYLFSITKFLVSFPFLSFFYFYQQIVEQVDCSD
jgi:hypothetical protein